MHSLKEIYVQGMFMIAEVMVRIRRSYNIYICVTRVQ